MYWPPNYQIPLFLMVQDMPDCRNSHHTKLLEGQVCSSLMQTQDWQPLYSSLSSLQHYIQDLGESIVQLPSWSWHIKLNIQGTSSWNCCVDLMQRLAWSGLLFLCWEGHLHLSGWAACLLWDLSSLW